MKIKMKYIGGILLSAAFTSVISCASLKNTNDCSSAPIKIDPKGRYTRDSVSNTTIGQLSHNGHAYELNIFSNNKLNGAFSRKNDGGPIYDKSGNPKKIYKPGKWKQCGDTIMISFDHLKTEEKYLIKEDKLTSINQQIETTWIKNE